MVVFLVLHLCVHRDIYLPAQHPVSHRKRSIRKDLSALSLSRFFPPLIPRKFPVRLLEDGEQRASTWDLPKTILEVLRGS